MDRHCMCVCVCPSKVSNNMIVLAETIKNYYRLPFSHPGWTVRGSNAGVGEIFRTLPERSGGLPSLLYNAYRLFPGGKAAGAWC